MLENGVHGINKGPTRIYEIKWKGVIYTRRGWEV